MAVLCQVLPAMKCYLTIGLEAMRPANKGLEPAQMRVQMNLSSL
jgi:hypothetical protein